MLGNSRVHPVLLAMNLAEAREFYHDKIGLEISAENDDRIEFRCGRGIIQLKG
jgi:catechol 2,3-dioxygenase-like lactoylglutathione lyase family enzyme